MDKVMCKECGTKNVNPPTPELRYCPVCGNDLYEQECRPQK